MSPELGTNSSETDSFFLESKTTLQEVVSQNFEWVAYTFESLFSKLELKPISFKHTSTFTGELTVEMTNWGIEEFTG
jgi:hypothetical protein